jgi:hypothetical protein
MDIKIIRFKTEYTAGKPPFDMVEYAASDAIDESGKPRSTTWARISQIKPPEHINNDDGGIKMGYMRAFWDQVGPKYERWKANDELPVDGTPLGVWPGVNSDQADALRGVGLTSIEAVANMSEAIIANPPLPNMREIKRQAQLWIDGQGDVALQARLAELEEQNAAMLAMLEAQTAEQPEPEKRGPGRPPQG